MSANGSKSLYTQVLVAVVIGALLGHFYPAYGKLMQPLGDGFVKLVRMVIAPIIFVTVAVGNRETDRHQGGGPDRAEGDRLFRGHDHAWRCSWG